MTRSDTAAQDTGTIIQYWIDVTLNETYYFVSNTLPVGIADLSKSEIVPI